MYGRPRVEHTQAWKALRSLSNDTEHASSYTHLSAKRENQQLFRRQHWGAAEATLESYDTSTANLV